MATRALSNADQPALVDETESLLRALIAQERENRAALKALVKNAKHEVERGNRMLIEAGLAPVL